MKKVFGMINKKKGDDSDEEWPSYTDPAVLHATDPPSRNSRGILQPHYPPPRPCHSGNSPNPRRKNPDTAVVQGNKKPQLTENNRNSALNLVPGEPKRAPPRINITKKVNRLSKFSTTYILFHNHIVKCRLENVYEKVFRSSKFISKWQVNIQEGTLCYL
jgi:hypothetical protein